MHELHRHLAETLADKLTKRRVVVWYDSRGEFSGFVTELLGGSIPDECRLDTVTVGDRQTRVCVLHESFFEVKFLVEPIVSKDLPESVVIYVPGKTRDDATSVLMELEAAGERWEPQLKRESRRVLRQQLGDGQIDQIFASPNVTYRDIVALLEGGGTQGTTGSLLKVIYQRSGGSGSNADLLADWLAISDKYQEIVEKGATTELFQLIGSRLGLELPANTDLNDAARKVARYVLVAEFRNDLKDDAPASLKLVGQPASKQLELALEVAAKLRQRHAEAYITIADTVETELNLASLGVAAEKLGKIDTFRFEEKVLLDYVGRLIVSGQFADALEVIQHRRLSFWALHQIQRQEQWLAYDLAAQLGMAVKEISGRLPDSRKTVIHWVEGYTHEKGWYRADLLHRRLESTLASMTDSIASEKVMHRVSKDYEDLVDRMTSGFVNVFRESSWTVPGILHQTDIYDQVVQNPGETVCFLMVDALRYEMGVELKGLLENAEELSIRPAIAAIPTITPVGMAALMPGAETSFSVVPSSRDLGGKVGNSIAGNLNERKRIWQGRVPDVVDLELDRVLSPSNSDLKRRIAGAPLVLVRSVEIDSMGEGGNTFLARQVMDTAINNVARAVRRLAGLGISRFVISADHGHLFVHERDESKRIDKPGGEQVAMHRRCWAGRGGTTPPATVRVSASQLGYDSDLDFVFPTNISVFKAGGDLAYYHGGLSMQELLIPVLSVRMPTQPKRAEIDVEITLGNLPEKVANRIVTFRITSGSLMFVDEITIRPVLMSNGQLVGHVGMVLDAVFDSTTQCVRMKPGTTCSVGIQLLREDIESVEIVVLDPDTDRILVKSQKIAVKLGI